MRKIQWGILVAAWGNFTKINALKGGEFSPPFS